MIERIPEKLTPEEAIEHLSRGFIGLLKRIDAERDRQLTSPNEYKYFRQAYEAVYPDDYQRLAKSYSSHQVKTDHPLELIRNARDTLEEAEKQALLIIGARLLEQTHNEGLVLNIVLNIVFQNEIDLPKNVLAAIRTMGELLNSEDDLDSG